MAFACALEIVFDLKVRRYRQRMPIMAVVWPVTALYLGPIATWAYRRFGRSMSPRWLREQGLDEPPSTPEWAATAVGVSHCGAGCTVGDIIAVAIGFCTAWPTNSWLIRRGIKESM